MPDAALVGEAMALARRIAANAPLAVRATKRMFRMAERETFDDHVHQVYLQLLPLFGSADFREGMAAFLERRAATFEARLRLGAVPSASLAALAQGIAA